MRVGYSMLVAITLLLCSWYDMTVAAETQRQHGAHVHGAGKLNLVQEGNQLHIELEIPGMDIVGFEHKARTDQQKQTVKDAIAVLKQGSELFRMNAEAHCTFGRAEVDVAMLGDDHEREHAKATAHQDDEKDHAGEKHAAHDEAGEESHAEFRVTYRFTCAAPEKLQQIGVSLFEKFQGADMLQAQCITERKQHAQRLTRGAPVMQLD